MCPEYSRSCPGWFEALSVRTGYREEHRRKDLENRILISQFVSSALSLRKSIRMQSRQTRASFGAVVRLRLFAGNPNIRKLALTRPRRTLLSAAALWFGRKKV